MELDSMTLGLRTKPVRSSRISSSLATRQDTRRTGSNRCGAGDLILETRPKRTLIPTTAEVH